MAGGVAKSGSSEVFLQQAAYAPSREPSAVTIHGQRRFSDSSRFAARELRIDTPHCHASTGTQAISASLAANPDQFLFKTEIVKIQADKLTDSETPTIERLKHGRVTHSKWRLDRYGIKQAKPVCVGFMALAA